MIKTFLTLFVLALFAASTTAAERVELKTDDSRGELSVLIGGKEAAVYQYGKSQDQVHWYPIRSPSGKLLTIQQTEPYPHHRSFWFGDDVQLGNGPRTMFYQPFYTRVDKKNPKSPYRDQILHVKFLRKETNSKGAQIEEQLLWATNQGKTPVMDDVRTVRIVPLGNGEYFLDCRYKVTASYGDVKFLSDKIHYAWPYLRIHPQFAVEKISQEKPAKGNKKPVPDKQSGTITNSAGQINGKGTYLKPAKWVDYSAPVDTVTEGLAMYADPKEPEPKWFTRDYGTFGPRRLDAFSGTKFVLKKGDSMSRRVGVLVHRGDAQEGHVAQRYQDYADGKL
jgi:hypothetical protein